VSLIARDIGDRRDLELQLASQALHDSLTGLPNRALLRDRLAQALAGSERRNVPVAVLFLDLDGFRSVNDAHGEPAADRLLVDVAKRLQTEVRPGDTVARFGADEFLIVCDAADVDEAERVAQRMTATLRHPFAADGRTIAVSASIGIAVTPPMRADVDVLLRSAYAAMSDAKARGGARWRVFDAPLAKQLADRAELSDALREALADDALEVHYQPVVQLATGRLVGVEALTRWEHPKLGEVSPSVFVPLAEEEGFVSVLDRWVLARVCRDAAALRASGCLPEDGKVALNLSARNLGDPAMLEAVRRAALGAGLPLDALEIEVTETAVMNDPVDAAKTLTALRRLGVGIALDDFGTGYSSLTYLRQLPVSTIKIDRSFIHDITASADGRAIVAAIVDLARAVGARTIAEGVEDLTQLALLHQLGCSTGQGYLWSTALPRDELVTLLRQQDGGFHAATAPADSDADTEVASARRPRTDEPWLSRMRYLHAEGASAATIAAALNTEGHRTPAGVRWQASTVQRAMAEVEQRRRTRLSI
jgi:diguanylate cyclase (GGDEF)-like protein